MTKGCTLLDKVDPTKYIRHFWNSCHDFTREKELYRAISKTIKNPRESNELLNSLAKNAGLYHDLTYPNDCNYFTDEKLVTTLKSIGVLKAKSFYPIILAIMQAENQYTNEELGSVLETIEKYVFRNFTICGKVANKAEIYMAKIAKQIYDGSILTSDEICSEIKKGMVSDSEFINMVEIWSGNKSNKETIRYIFRKIHKFCDKSMELNIDASEVHIEHIMPENNSEWNMDESIHDEYLWRLGNLCLLDGRLNIRKSNHIFEIKKEAYIKSKIEPNHEIAIYEEWGKETIGERQKRLAEYAVKIWNFD